jgi:hypothetical protein
MTGSGRPVEQAEFAFFLHQSQQLREDERKFVLTREDLRLINPNTRTCPIFRSRRDAEITRAIYRRVPVLVDEARGDEGNPWGVRFLRMFDMSNDSGLFRTRAQLESEGWMLSGNVFHKGGNRYLPLYEGKMVGAFDHRAANVITREENAKRPGQPISLTVTEHIDEYMIPAPQYWINSTEVLLRDLGNVERRWYLAFKSITSPTNERTLVAALLPQSGVANSMIVVNTCGIPPETGLCLPTMMNSFVVDYVARQKIGGVNLNFFYVKQFPFLQPSAFDKTAKWTNTILIRQWLTPRILELTYTAWDLQGFAKDLGSDGPPYNWDTDRRLLIRCELDAAFFHLYGISRDDVDYIMDTFPIVERHDQRDHGEYRTKRIILEMYDAMQRAIETGQPYQTPLDPPPGDPRAAHQLVGAVTRS